MNVHARSMMIVQRRCSAALGQIGHSIFRTANSLSEKTTNRRSSLWSFTVELKPLEVKRRVSLIAPFGAHHGTRGVHTNITDENIYNNS